MALVSASAAQAARAATPVAAMVRVPSARDAALAVLSEAIWNEVRTPAQMLEAVRGIFDAAYTAGQNAGPQEGLPDSTLDAPAN